MDSKPCRITIAKTDDGIRIDIAGKHLRDGVVCCCAPCSSSDAAADADCCPPADKKDKRDTAGN